MSDAAVFATRPPALTLWYPAIHVTIYTTSFASILLFHASPRSLGNLDGECVKQQQHTDKQLLSVHTRQCENCCCDSDEDLKPTVAENEPHSRSGRPLRSNRNFYLEEVSDTAFIM